MGWDTTLLQKALDNRIGCFAAILLMGSVSQGLVSSGAFEVFYNGKRVDISSLPWIEGCDVWLSVCLLFRQLGVLKARSGSMAHARRA
jgi:hypothetical protein